MRFLAAGNRVSRQLAVCAMVGLVPALSACGSGSKGTVQPAQTTVPSSVAGPSTTVPVTATTASAATSTTAATALSTACIFGNWTITAPASFSGSSWTIHPNGTADVNYQGVLTGPATFDTTLPANPPGSTGSYVASPVSQHVTSAGRSVTLTAHQTTWTCQGDSLTLVVASSGTFQLSRHSS